LLEDGVAFPAEIPETHVHPATADCEQRFQVARLLSSDDIRTAQECDDIVGLKRRSALCQAGNAKQRGADSQQGSNG